MSVGVPSITSHAFFDGLFRGESNRAYLITLFIPFIFIELVQGMWVWLGDHDLDGTSHGQITVYSGRGVLSESAGPVWLVGTGVSAFSNILHFI